MRVALISDLHFGCRNDNQVHLEHTRRFFDEQFFPYLDRNGISDVFVLGDILDRRKYINIHTAHFVRKHILDKLASYHVYMLLGNHDAYHTNSLEVNSVEEIIQVRDRPKFAIISEPCEIRFVWGKVLFLPWICLDNEQLALKLIESTDAKLCFGHLELKGFESHAGYVIDRGLDISLFAKFSVVASGHIHKRQTIGNATYLGSPFQITWADYDSPKGFHTFDPATHRLDFVLNPTNIFHKIVYDDAGQTLEQVMDWDFKAFADSYVKVLVQKKTNPYYFDMFVEAVEKFAIDVKVVNEFLTAETTMALNGECENTVTILRRFIEESNFSGDKKQLDKFLTDLYNTALATMED